MSYRIVYPVAMPIDANDFREAVKKFIKLNHFMNIEQIVLTDQYNHMKANVKYYDADRRRKASIQLLPMDAAAVATFPGIVGFSSNNPKAPYPNPGLSFAVGPSSIGGPAGIISPAGPLMVERPAMIGSPMMGGPMMGSPMMGGPGVAGVIYGARPVNTSSEEIIRIDEQGTQIIAITKDGSTFPISKIEKINNNTCKVFGPGGKTSLIKTEIIDGNRITFANKKIKPDDEETMFDLTDIINKTASTTTVTPMTVGPTHIVTPSKQIIPVGPVPFGSGVIAGAQPSGIIGMSGGPGVVVGGPAVVGSPVRFGRGVY